MQQEQYDIDTEVPVIFLSEKQGKDRYFVPNLRDEYPELADISEFRVLSRYELYLCWLIGCSYSHYNLEIANHPETNGLKSKIVNSAVEDCFGGKTRRIGDEVFEAYSKGDFPEKIRAGIDRFKKFRVRERYRAQIATASMFHNLMDNLQKMQGQVANIEDAKKYAELSKITYQNIKEMLPKVEQGFGFKDVDGDMEHGGKQDSRVSKGKKLIQENGREPFL